MPLLNPPRWVQSPLGACLLYAGISVMLTFFNKGIFSYYHFKHPVRARAEAGSLALRVGPAHCCFASAGLAPSCRHHLRCFR